VRALIKRWAIKAHGAGWLPAWGVAALFAVFRLRGV
jgi:hypothetical protein